MSITEKLIEAVSVGALATLGGVANYLNAVYIKRQQEFSAIAFVVNVVLAFFVGNMVGSFIDLNNQYRDGVIMAAGYCTFPILSTIETKVKRILSGMMDKM